MKNQKMLLCFLTCGALSFQDVNASYFSSRAISNITPNSSVQSTRKLDLPAPSVSSTDFRKVVSKLETIESELEYVDLTDTPNNSLASIVSPDDVKKAATVSVFAYVLAFAGKFLERTTPKRFNPSAFIENNQQLSALFNNPVVEQITPYAPYAAAGVACVIAYRYFNATKSDVQKLQDLIDGQAAAIEGLASDLTAKNNALLERISIEAGKQDATISQQTLQAIRSAVEPLKHVLDQQQSSSDTYRAGQRSLADQVTVLSNRQQTFADQVGVLSNRQQTFGAALKEQVAQVNTLQAIVTELTKPANSSYEPSEEAQRQDALNQLDPSLKQTILEAADIVEKTGANAILLARTSDELTAATAKAKDSQFLHFHTPNFGNILSLGKKPKK